MESIDDTVATILSILDGVDGGLDYDVVIKVLREQNNDVDRTIAQLLDELAAGGEKTTEIPLPLPPAPLLPPENQVTASSSSSEKTATNEINEINEMDDQQRFLDMFDGIIHRQLLAELWEEACMSHICAMEELECGAEVSTARQDAWDETSLSLFNKAVSSVLRVLNDATNATFEADFDGGDSSSWLVEMDEYIAAGFVDFDDDEGESNESNDAVIALIMAEEEEQEEQYRQFRQREDEAISPQQAAVLMVKRFLQDGYLKQSDKMIHAALEMNGFDPDAALAMLTDRSQKPILDRYLTQQSGGGRQDGKPRQQVSGSSYVGALKHGVGNAAFDGSVGVTVISGSGTVLNSPSAYDWPAGDDGYSDNLPADSAQSSSSSSEKRAEEAVWRQRASEEYINMRGHFQRAAGHGSSARAGAVASEVRVRGC